MAKAGMRRFKTGNPQGTEDKESRNAPRPPKNDVKPVPELQGKAKNGKQKAKPVDYGRRA